ncbi:OLC1v1006509C2 [Oldenlandia corymbosa var. corymbosa]|uniref:ATP-dependent DNA helicase n=1 Tax=Oldenlandia corymbosa var. corymbosa TaxID=529605 RepID=A0AAV1DH71_OLDCO|nr:OLC1v1006509C2 [Oldenlandia corymbosa var. corymbosa]
MESVLKQYFGFSTFRPYQREIVEKIVDGRDCLVVMSTGSGKSLCYQLPPLITKKTAVIISPLISLMQDQVMALKERGIRTEHLSSAQNASNVQSIAERGQYDILYMTPEKACLLPSSFWAKMQETGICLLAVDEAHCISEWGHDFRVEYKRLDRLRNVLQNVPFIGLTATATEKVRLDIISSLKMRDPYVAVGSFDRQNLFYGVKPFNHSLAFMDELVEDLNKYAQSASSTIVYCTTVKDTEEIFKLLLKAGVKAGIYHGQMSNSAREKSHRSFIRDEYYVMVATIAFGMGIDKPDIRYVIHYGCPKSLEAYYQESGRCGRDGVASVCWLYYSRGDFVKVDFYCKEAKSADQKQSILEAYEAARHYCFLTTCRRKYLLKYFGQEIISDRCGNCDNCTSSKKENDMAREAFLLMGCMRSCRGKWGLNMPIDVLRGSRSKKILEAQLDKLPFHGLGKEITADWWKSLGDQLISNGYLIEKYDSMYRNVSLTAKGLQFLSSCRPDYQPPLYLPIASETISDVEIKNPSSVVSAGCEGMSQAEQQLYKLLLDERMKLARGSGTAPYAICGDETVRRMALTRPSTRARLANIEGVNQHLMKVHGDHFLQRIQQLCQELSISLDRDPDSQPPIQKQVLGVPRVKNLTPAKFEAWKMWQEEGLTIQKIANFPGRSAPIKEQTVMEYILEAAREGCQIDWCRFAGEIELTQEAYQSIQDVVAKVGKEKLKPIKNELPEEITYAQIKACLTMQELGSANALMQSNKEDENTNKLMEEATPSDNTLQGKSTDGSVNIVRKRQKVDLEVENEAVVLATRNSIVNWLEKFSSGVTLSEILEHFNGSTEESVVELLSSLEGEFVIFRKNDLYMLL